MNRILTQAKWGLIPEDDTDMFEINGKLEAWKKMRTSKRSNQCNNDWTEVKGNNNLTIS